MTILSACQDAFIYLFGKKPSTIFSAQDAESLKMQMIANEVAKDIAATHDWQALMSTHILTADGTTQDFALPDDYDRMLLDTTIYDAQNWAWGYSRIVRPNDWLARKISAWNTITPGHWTMMGNQLKFLPAPASGSAEFLYISANRVLPETGDPKAAFTKDSDSFVLSERLLMLGIIWKWRERDGLNASADQANFEKTFGELAARDSGPRIIRRNATRARGNFHLGWPWPLGGE